MRKPDFSKILKKYQTHSTIMDELSIIEALEECYQLGLKQSEGDKIMLKNAFQSLLYEFASTGKIKKAQSLFIEEWEKKAGIY